LTDCIQRIYTPDRNPLSLIDYDFPAHGKYKDFNHTHQERHKNICEADLFDVGPEQLKIQIVKTQHQQYDCQQHPENPFVPEVFERHKAENTAA
jgi:hypothetical protein